MRVKIDYTVKRTTYAEIPDKFINDDSLALNIAVLGAIIHDSHMREDTPRVASINVTDSEGEEIFSSEI